MGSTSKRHAQLNNYKAPLENAVGLPSRLYSQPTISLLSTRHRFCFNNRARCFDSERPPEHVRLGPFTGDLILAAGWVDLGQHLVAVWRWVEEILQVYDLMNVGLANSSLDRAKEAVAAWLRDDACAARLTEAEAAFLAQVSPKDEVPQ